MPATDHPTREELFEFLVGTLSEEAAETISVHLDTCTVCQVTLAELDDSEDALVGKLRQRDGADPYADEPQREMAVQRAKAAVVAGESQDVSETTGSSGGADRTMDVSADAGAAPLGEMGEYQLLEELGSGGMGAVYKALQTNLDRVVALKVLSWKHMDDEGLVARFYREMKAVGRLSHPNIVQAHDAREIEETPILAMEYIEGPTLSQIVKRCGPLPIADACELIRQAAVGLHYAHENGMVHRDIKPSNLMLAVSDQLSAISQEELSSQSQIANRQS